MIAARNVGIGIVSSPVPNAGSACSIVIEPVATESLILSKQDLSKLSKNGFGCPCQPGKIFNSYQV